MEKPQVPAGKFLSIFKNSHPIEWFELEATAKEYIIRGVEQNYLSGRITSPIGDVYIYQILDDN